MLDYRSPLRPPGAIDEKKFIQRCIKCNKCIQVCPYLSIQVAHLNWGVKYGTPIIIARDVPCYVCMKCPEVCPTGALDNNLTETEKIRMGVAVIDTEKCFPYNGIICRACFERCPIFREAITLKDELLPEVHPDRCIGCGICEHVCPLEVPAIIVRSAHNV